MGAKSSVDDQRGIRERLAQLAEIHSQAEIARRTGTQRMNVTRYLRGTRIPADFCSILTRELGVNPQWLLTGDGPRMLSDTAGSRSMASEMVQLVQAMSEVARMRLGSLGGKSHLQALRELHDAIDTFENLRQRLGKNTDSTLAQLLTDFEAALNDDKEGLARSMATAAGKLAQLAADESLRDRYLHLRARFEVKYGNSDEALRIQRVTFLRTLSSGPFVNNDMINRMGNFVTILWANGRSAEARRMTRAARELLHDNPKSEQWRYILDVAEGTTAMELGDLPTAITAYTSTYNKLPEPQRHVVEAYRRMALFVSGTMSFEALDLLELTHRIQAVAMLRMAAIEETSKSLKRALAKYTGAGPTLAGQDLLTTQHIRCLADAIKGDSGALKRFQEFAQKERFKDRLPTVLHDFVIAVYVCQVARLAGNRDVALDHLMQAEKEFCGLDSEITPPIWLRIIHTRNALELIPLKAKSAAQRNLRARVKEFVDDYISRGYVLLKDFPA